MALSSEEFEKVQWAFRHQILKVFVRVCMINLVQSFNVLKVNSQVKHNICEMEDADKASILYRVLSRVFNNRKKMVYNWIKNVQDQQEYWRTKACILMKGLLQKKVNNMTYIGLMKIGDERTVAKPSKINTRNPSLLKQNPEEQYINFYLKHVSKIIGNANCRALASAFSIIFNHASNTKTNNRLYDVERKETKIWTDTIKFSEPLQILVRRAYLEPFKRIKKILTGKQKELAQSQQQEEEELDEYEQEIQISQIKSIILTNLANQKKQKPKPCPHQKQYSARTIASILSQHYTEQISSSFQRIKWKFVEYYDDEMVEKLETEINVLQHEFDSL